MRNKTLIFLVSILLFGACINKARKYYNRGKIEFEQDNFDFAAENMKQAIEYGASKKDAAPIVAESYRLSNRSDLAAKYYKMALDNGAQDENILFYYGFALKSEGNFIAAEKALKKYVELGSNFDYLQRSKKEIKNIEYLKKFVYKKPKYEVENCKEINTEYIEYSPMFNHDDFYFSSSRGEGPMFPGQGTRFTDIFEYKFDGITRYSGFATPLNELINQPKTHESTSTFSPDGQTMIFSRSNSGKKNDPTQEVDLFETQMVNGEWTDPIRLEFCEKNAWDSNPFWSKDGQRLYFASNREGGQGGDDIWFVEKDDFGVWGIPQNLGKPVNTAGSEQFPYEREDGTIYFASDGHPSLGGLDIFKAVKAEDGHLMIRNLGKPLSSYGDDFAIIFTSDTSGFFTSNRKGGKGDDDIYAFNYTFKPHYILKSVVYGKEIEGEIEKEVLLPNAKVVLMDEDGQIIDLGVADSNATIKFFVEAEKEYLLKGEKVGYITRQEQFSTIGMTIPQHKLEMMEKDVIFKKKVVLDHSIAEGIIAFEPIYYKYNKWDITQASEIILNEMVQVLNDNPKILVELGSHTDPRGTPKYNEILSQKRAESAVDYIINKGIDAQRITAKGYGETLPKVLRKDTGAFISGTQLGDIYLDSLKLVDSVAYELGNQLNRRTEFKIVGFIDENHDAKDIKMINTGRKEKIIEENNIKHQDELIEKYLKKEEEEEVPVDKTKKE